MESIPDSDYISRHVFFPIMYGEESDLIWENVFIFRSRDDYCESVVWRKYATPEEVHELGCAKAERDRIGNPDRPGKPDREYKGIYTGIVGEVRIIVCSGNIFFKVIHDPSNDQGNHHTHLKVVLPEGKTKLNKNDKPDLWLTLADVFSSFESYP